MWIPRFGRIKKGKRRCYRFTDDDRACIQKLGNYAGVMIRLTTRHHGRTIFCWEGNRIHYILDPDRYAMQRAHRPSSHADFIHLASPRQCRIAVNMRPCL